MIETGVFTPILPRGLFYLRRPPQSYILADRIAPRQMEADLVSGVSKRSMGGFLILRTFGWVGRTEHTQFAQHRFSSRHFGNFKLAGKK